MTTLFYDQFESASQWTGVDIVSVADPLKKYSKVATLSSTRTGVSSLSKIIYNPSRSYKIYFNYLGLAKNIEAGVNLGCMLSISDGGSLSTKTTAVAGAIKDSTPPMCATRIVVPNDCQDKCYGGYGTYPNYPYCLGWSDSYIKFYKSGSFIRLTDNGSWKNYSLSFTAANENIRVGLSDFSYSNYPDRAFTGDCYFANLMVTDSDGPTPNTVPTCSNFTLSLSTSSSTPLNFKDSINDVEDNKDKLKIKIHDFPDCGSILDGVGNPVLLKSNYGISSLVYKACITPSQDAILYSVVDGESLESINCSINITISNNRPSDVNSSPSASSNISLSDVNSSPSASGNIRPSDVNSSPNTGSNINCDFKGAVISGNVNIVCNQNINSPTSMNTYRINGNAQLGKLNRGDKLDVNLYDCVKENLHKSCSISATNSKEAFCIFNFLNLNKNEEAKVVLDSIPILNTVSDVADYFNGHVVDNICNNPYASGALSNFDLEFATALVAISTFTLLFD